MEVPLRSYDFIQVAAVYLYQLAADPGLSLALGLDSRGYRNSQNGSRADISTDCVDNSINLLRSKSSAEQVLLSGSCRSRL